MGNGFERDRGRKDGWLRVARNAGWGWSRRRHNPHKTKVFCFFFSKKKRSLASPAERPGMKLSYIVLGHQHPVILCRLVNALVQAGHTVALHYDKKSDNAGFALLQERFAGNPSVRFARRVSVRWGEWSIVEATLNCIDEIAASGWEPDYVYYASGADYPIRSSDDLIAFLERNNGREFIEGVPTDKRSWVKGGPEQERYQYRFYTNWRDRHELSKKILEFQKTLGLKRKFVLGLEPHMGSQWWVLTWQTIKRVMELANRRDVRRFFRTTLIPDELFFQTLVCNLVPSSKIVARPLTLYQFTDYFVPIIFCADRVDYLVRQPFFMARKLSPHRLDLYDELDKVWLGHTRTLGFENDEAAKISGEYEENRLKYRDGVPGVPVYGKPVQKWYEDLGRLNEPFFAVMGLSTVELKIAFLLLSCSKKIVCHGQIFHSRVIEFAHGGQEYAGYTRDAVRLRNTSAPNFVANLVRASPDKMTGFLIRSGQGWHVPEIIFDRPNPRALLLRGDPLIGFAESLSADEPTLSERIDWNLVEAMPPSVLVRKWNDFLPKFRQRLERLDQLVSQGIEKKRSHNWTWLTEVDLDVTRPSGLHAQNVMRVRADLAGWSGITLSRWRDWMVPAGKNLGVYLPNLVPAETWREITTTLAGLETGRKMLISALAAGGVQVTADYDPPETPESFMPALRNFKTV
jgi:hypothetical protein